MTSVIDSQAYSDAVALSVVAHGPNINNPETKQFLIYLIHACIYALPNVKRPRIEYIQNNSKFELFCERLGLNLLSVISWLFSGHNPKVTSKYFSFPCSRDRRELKAKLAYAVYKNDGVIPENLKWKEIEEFIRKVDESIIPFLSKFEYIKIDENTVYTNVGFFIIDLS